jgi:hypothetical protein
MSEQTQSADSGDPLASLEADRFVRVQANLNENVQPFRQLLADSVASPLHYPPLSESLFPGDTIAIALQHDLPRPAEVLNSLLDQLLTINIEPTDITVVLPGSLADEFALKPADYRAVAPEGQDEPSPPPIFPLQREFHSIACQVHDPDNAAGLAYLVANEGGDPVHMNRVLVDADVVIPVGCPANDPNAVADCLYPTFGSAAAVERFGTNAAPIVAQLEEADLANNTLGAFFEIQLVTLPRDQIAEVVCGTRQDAILTARRRASERWAVETDGSFDAAVVTIESRPFAQTWKDFAAALVQASQLTKADAPIVVWSELSMTADRATRKACQARFEETIPTKLSKQLQHVASILKDHPVFLRSQLSRSAVEDLGLSVLETTAEINRVTESSESCLVLRDAHRVRVATPEAVGDVE